ncbi:MAG: LysM peptidoglycan-binding domain-containing M23 family metallopeptidase [Cyanophyceae cyanobacterium]
MLSWLVIPIFASANAVLLPGKEPSASSLAQSEVGAARDELNCAESILSRVQRHRIAPGESVEGIASQYGLLPGTLIAFNPTLQNGAAPIGTEILVPPVNGVRIEVPAGTTWQDLASAYGVRADVLFEANGCQQTPTVVFLPGVSWSAASETVDNYTGLAGYPLPEIASVGLSYGWQSDPTNQDSLFHSGIDLLADSGTSVLAADAGTVAYVGQDENYGNFIAIDHGEGRQTRYAHLGSIRVSASQSVASGDVIGTVGTTGQPDIEVPHLHFEVRFNSPAGWVAQNPQIHLKTR